MKAYTPINCDLYDALELFALRKQPVEIVYKGKESAEKVVTARVRTFTVRDKVEYLVLENEEEIRLDNLKAVGGIDMTTGAMCATFQDKDKAP